MKELISIFLFLTGIVLSAYLGFWCCTVGGIIDVINAIKHTPVDSFHVAIGLVKFAISGFVGWGTFAVFMAMASATSK